MKINILLILIFTKTMSSYAQENNPIQNKAIIFRSGFEEGNKDIWDDWDENPDESNLIMEDPGPFDTPGNHIMKLIPPSGERGGADLVKELPSQHDSLYLRFYIKYEEGFNFNAPNHGGGLVAGDRSLMGQSGIRPDGADRASCKLEYNTSLRTPQIYAYYRGMHQDCTDPNGSCWGDVFPCTSDEGQTYCEHEQHRDPPLPQELEADRWYSIEIKWKLGTPSVDGSVSDGEISLWIDDVNYGKWDDLWIRTTEELKISILWLSLFHHDGTHADAGAFYDDIVVSTVPIGMGKVGTGYKEATHRELKEGEIPVTEPGYYGSPGATYVLTNDISSPKSAIFLGNNVTLDLNGYEVTYADAEYEHIPNYSFEEGLVEWDFSKAPSAEIVGKQVQVFVGDNVLRLKAGEEITSQYISLPLADRSYFAMCGVAKNTMRVSVYIEDESGDVVYSTNNYGDSQKQGSPVISKGTQLGGGFVYAHMVGQPAGQYRVRVKANTDAIIDHIDIRPSLDTGIGIVERTFTNAHTDHLYEGWYEPAFYDYTADFPSGAPTEGIPVVSSGERGTVTIKNGTIRSGTRGILSWGIQSTTNAVDFVIDNIKVVSSGINTNAIDVKKATITNCLFDINSPFIINRHGSHFYAVDLRGSRASEVSYSEFYGGQGCLNYQGRGTEVHHNFFANRQTVTNHYSIIAGGDHSKIYHNVFEPEIGSGVEIYKGNNIEIFNNEFHIEAAPPTCEYGHEDYSVNGIRMADYNASPGDPNGCYDNHIYNNSFYITGKDYPEYPDYIPVATAIFYSASGGDNYVYDNEVVVNALDPDSKARTNAFYVGGGTIGGVFGNNAVTTNVPAFWLASPYGYATKTKVIGNTIIRSSDALDSYVPIRLGHGSNLATEIDFISNDIVGGNGELEFGGTDRQHTYSVFWKYTLKVVDSQGNPIEGKKVKIIDNDENAVLEETTPITGVIDTILMEYDFYGRLEHGSNPYRVIVGDQEVVVSIEEDTEITLTVEVVAGVGPAVKRFTLSPNPVETKLELNFKTSENRKITIFDINHRIQSKYSSGIKDVELDMSSLPPGIYFLQIMEKGKTYAEKIIKY